MKNTPANLQLLNRLVTLCEGTPYEMHILEDEDTLGFYFFARHDAPEYTPQMFVDEAVFGKNVFRIRVQTTSYGSLSPAEILQVTQGLTTAAQLADAMCTEIRLAGCKVC